MRYLLVLFVLFLFACEEKTDLDIKKGDNDYIVIESIITSEFKQQKVVLSKPVSSIGHKPEMISGANVIVYVRDSVYVFKEEQPGIYLSRPFSATLKKDYNLQVFYDRRMYSSSAYAMPVTQFEKLSYFPSELNDSLFFVVENFDSYEDAMWEILLDWSDVSGYEDDSVNSAQLFYYTLHSVDVAEVFAPAHDKVYFPRGTKIIQKKYSLTSPHASFIRTLLSETYWRGGFFDVSPANTHTNMSEGAIGYFGACTVISDSLVVF